MALVSYMSQNNQIVYYYKVLESVKEGNLFSSLEKSNY